MSLRMKQREKLYTTKEFGAIIGMSRRMVQYYAKKGEWYFCGFPITKKSGRDYLLPAGSILVPGPRSPIKGGRPKGTTIENGAKRPNRGPNKRNKETC